MIFTTGVFAIFLAVVLPVYWLLPCRWRKGFLILAGMVFYFYSYPLHLLLVLVMTVVTYLIALGIWKERETGQTENSRAKLLVVVGISLAAGVLGYFKYWKMIVATLNSIFQQLHQLPLLPQPSILVPLAISFFTFEFIHFLADVYLGKIKRDQMNFHDYLLFIFFFPTLVSGPIKRYQSFHSQSKGMPSFRLDDILNGAKRVIFGLAQKFILADTAAQFTTALATPESAGIGALIVAVYAYSFKIYFDFAGYSDLAIGLALMLGFRVPENFNRPYLQPNIGEFWRCWHMSLSSWIRDYIYIPLGGNRRGFRRTLFNQVAAFTICGLWHGAAWNFVIWGLWHGLGQAGYRIWRRYIGERIPAGSILLRLVSILLTFHFVTAGWILFASPSLGKALITFERIAAAVVSLF
jgi:alginate O-acetyltransferase complex protein AlgI